MFLLITSWHFKNMDANWLFGRQESSLIIPAEGEGGARGVSRVMAGGMRLPRLDILKKIGCWILF